VKNAFSHIYYNVEKILKFLYIFIQKYIKFQPNAFILNYLKTYYQYLVMGLLNYLYKRVYGSNKVERKYGWKKGDKYAKHCKMLFTVENYHSNIKLVDLRDKCPDVYDQGKLGSCTANSLSL